MPIDELDSKIILELQKNGRLSYIELGNLLHVSETTARNRVKHLINEGIITINAIPDLETLGYNFMSIIGLQIRLTDMRDVVSRLVKHPNVSYLANITGRFDLMGIVVTRSPAEFSDFMENVLSAITGILRTETFVSLHVFKGQIVGQVTKHLFNNMDIPAST
jgi:Lrp/AsnC family transcriptional regulator for asnA, asnC and gidA